MNLAMHLSEMLLDGSVKSVAILGGAAMVTLVMSRASAAARHMVWGLALATALLLPAFSVALPHWAVAVLPAKAQPDLRTTVQIPRMDAVRETPMPVYLAAVGVKPAAVSDEPQALAIEPPHDQPVSWRAILPAVWGGGAAIVLATWVAGLIRLRQIVGASRSAPGGALVRMLEELRGELRIRRSVRLRLSATSLMPLAWGVFRPSVLLPEEAAAWNDDRARSVLLHELAHFARLDSATQVMTHFAAAVYWFNPLVWLAARRLRIERERACDDVVLMHGVGAANYAGDLLAVAGSLRVPLLAHAVGLAMARPSGLRRRVTAILDNGVNRRSLSGRVSVVVLVAAVVILLPLSALRLGVKGSQAKAADAPPAATTRPASAAGSMELLVIDQAAQTPIAGAQVRSNSPAGREQIDTDPDGIAAIRIPAGQFPALSLTVHRDGYVDKLLQWRGAAAGEHEAIPATYTLSLEKAAVISGHVVDESGQPVGTAHVVFNFTSEKPPSPHERTYVAFKEARTDSSGRWHFDGAPAHFQKVMIGVWDFQHLTGTFYEMSPYADVDKLHDGSATFTLPNAVAIAGVVLGPDGSPAAKATVGIGADRMASNIVPEIKANSQGRFSMGVKAGTDVVLTFKAAGCAPDIRQFTLDNDKKDLTVQLTKANKLTGTVVDPDGHPLAGAYIWLDTWRGMRTLTQQLRTDSSGKFSWDQAPADAVYADVEAPGFLRVNRVALKAGNENVVKVQGLLHVQGTVTDAQSGEPIATFGVVHGISFSDGNPITWERRSGDTAGMNGQFEYTQQFPYPAYAVRIEAEGYAPADSRVFTAAEGNVNLNFKLTRAENLGVRVLGPDGEPAAGATVALAGAGSYVRIINGERVQQSDDPQFITDSEGKLTIPPQPGVFKLAVFSAAGYAETDREAIFASHQIRLAAWGRIEGTVTVGGKPAAGAKISVDPLAAMDAGDPNAAHINHDIKTTTGPDGAYRFDRVPPGPVTVARYVEQGSGPAYVGMYADPHNVTVDAGKTVQVDLGSDGRLILGKIGVPPELAARQDWTFSFGSQAMNAVEMPTLPIPESVKSGGGAALRDWYNQFFRSDAGKTYRAAVEKANSERRFYPVMIAPDGTFKIEDVVPGKYSVSMSAVVRPQGVSGVMGDPIAEGVLSFEVPAGRNEQPMDVGAVPLQMIVNIGVGQAAPDFSMTTLDGQAFELKSLRGKYVLLDFWATWCGPCLTETPSLKAAYGDFGHDARFAMVSVSLDEKADEPRAYAAKNGMAWTQLFEAGKWDQPTVKAYGVRSIPSIWLIGPDGKVIAKDLRGEGIKYAIGAALGK